MSIVLRVVAIVWLALAGVAAAQLEPARITALSQHPESGVWTASLSNGVLVHHRPMAGDGRAVVCLTFAPDPGFDARSLDGLPALFEGAHAPISIKASWDRGTVRVFVATPTDTLRSTLTDVVEKLRRPVLDPRVLEAWEQTEREHDALVASVPSRALDLALDELLSADQRPSRRAPDADRLTHSLADVVGRAPLEAAIVGDIGREEALTLAVETVGSLPPREPVRTHEDLRAGAHPRSERGRIERRILLPAESPESIVLVGLLRGEVGDWRSVRALRLAASVLESRLEDRLRDSQHGYEARIGLGFDAAGILLFAAASTGPEGAPSLTQEIEAQVAGLAASPPTPRELARARGEVVSRVERILDDPWYWARWVSESTLRGFSLDDIVRAREDYAGLTGGEIEAEFGSLWHDGVLVSVRVEPRSPAER
ncbi:MAG: insulinase family protein [Phycisphaeraceae bacterium]|nr:insulinase family protein [Phycisphaeraceae bacterium]